ncbi:MAG: hypothetical protein ACRCZK_01770 [Oscillospiraceae bacterium]
MNLDSETQILGGGYSNGGSGNLLEGLIFGALLSGNGLGGNRGAVVADETCNQTLQLIQAGTANTNQISQTLANGFSGVQNRFDSVSNGLVTGFAGVNSAVNEVKSAILESKYDTALQMCQQTNILSTQMNAGFQGIKDQMNCQVVKDLERQLAVAENGGPIVRAGTFVQANPCQDNARITNIEQTVIQVGNALSAIQGALVTGK